MTGLGNLIRRNCNMYFKDKGTLFTSLITPLILLVLYATFLSNVYRDSFTSSMPDFFKISDSIIDATVGGQLISSLLAVSCVTVTFCSNMLMVSDKVTGAYRDITVTPVKRSTIALAYYVSTTLSSLLVCLVAAGSGFLYLYFNAGWYLTVTDVLCVLLDIFLLVMFGTALSSLINVFLSTQGQISAVGTVISAGYGFICGAYMPISNFSEGLQRVLSFLPGTYGTSLVRNHCLRGVFEEMGEVGFPKEVVEGIKDSIDCNLFFFGEKVELSTMYLILGGAVILLIGLYILVHLLRKKHS